MARYKHIDAPQEVPLGDTSPRFLAVDLERQLLPGTFEHALCWLIDHEIDLSGFDARYRNDLTGATAYPPTPAAQGGLVRLFMPGEIFAWHRQLTRDRARLLRTRHFHCAVRRFCPAL